MDPTSRSSQKPYYPLINQKPSTTKARGEVTIAIAAYESPTPACQCSQQTQRMTLDRAQTQEQRACDVCARTFAQNQTRSAALNETKDVAWIQNSSGAIDDDLGDYDDKECKRRVRCLQFMGITGIISILAIMVIGFSED